MIPLEKSQCHLGGCFQSLWNISDSDVLSQDWHFGQKSWLSIYSRSQLFVSYKSSWSWRLLPTSSTLSMNTSISLGTLVPTNLAFAWKILRYVSDSSGGWSILIFGFLWAIAPCNASVLTRLWFAGGRLTAHVLMHRCTVQILFHSVLVPAWSNQISF